VTRLRKLLGDRRRRQRGSILSAVLIIVAFLSILVGALMTELTSSFLISRTLVTRMQNEATVTSAVELGIHQLQGRAVPPVCAWDSSGLPSFTLNGSHAVVTETCTEIYPDPPDPLAVGAFTIGGVRDTSAGRDRYLVSDSSGLLRAYAFGQVTPSWALAIGGPPTAPLLPKTDSNGSSVLLVPAAISGPGCAGHCVALFNDAGGAPTFRCSMRASTTVTTTPAAEVSSSRSFNFPDYAFFGGSGAAGRLYVYDAAAGGSCAQLASAALGGVAAGAPLVFPGTVSGSRDRTINDEIFVLVTNSNSTNLQHWRYTEVTENRDGGGDTTISLSQVGNLSLIGGNAVGYAVSSTVPASGTTLSLAVTTAPGRLEMARIAVRSGPSYNMSLGPSTILPNGDATARAPYWCHCPTGQNQNQKQDLIGVGGNKGFLYLFHSGLTQPPAYTYDVQVGINTTPIADANGDWYFGTIDGSIYDVEIPMSGQQMFKAAKFGPGGRIASPPIVGACPGGQCLYYASSTAGSWFARLGGTRVIDLIACVSSASDSTKCAANPQLWARVEVGSPTVVGGRGVYVQGWSYYSPSPSP
jgi:hypothetical protein